jgi:hypothetical protein
MQISGSSRAISSISEEGNRDVELKRKLWRFRAIFEINSMNWVSVVLGKFSVDGYRQ